MTTLMMNAVFLLKEHKDELDLDADIDLYMIARLAQFASRPKDKVTLALTKPKKAVRKFGWDTL